MSSRVGVNLTTFSPRAQGSRLREMPRLGATTASKLAGYTVALLVSLLVSAQSVRAQDTG